VGESHRRLPGEPVSKPSVAANSTESQPRSQLFTVRVWQEELGEGRSEWRGQVRHVLSGETRHFRDWPSLVTFIVEIAATAVE